MFHVRLACSVCWVWVCSALPQTMLDDQLIVLAGRCCKPRLERRLVSFAMFCQCSSSSQRIGLSRKQPSDGEICRQNLVQLDHQMVNADQVIVQNIFHHISVELDADRITSSSGIPSKGATPETRNPVDCRRTAAVEWSLLAIESNHRWPENGTMSGFGFGRFRWHWLSAFDLYTPPVVTFGEILRCCARLDFSKGSLFGGYFMTNAEKTEGVKQPLSAFGKEVESEPIDHTWNDPTREVNPTGQPDGSLLG